MIGHPHPEQLQQLTAAQRRWLPSALRMVLSWLLHRSALQAPFPPTSQPRPCLFRLPAHAGAPAVPILPQLPAAARRDAGPGGQALPWRSASQAARPARGSGRAVRPHGSGGGRGGGRSVVMTELPLQEWACGVLDSASCATLAQDALNSRNPRNPTDQTCFICSQLTAPTLPPSNANAGLVGTPLAFSVPPTLAVYAHLTLPTQSLCLHGFPALTVGKPQHINVSSGLLSENGTCAACQASSVMRVMARGLGVYAENHRATMPKTFEGPK